ncbi:uncharacterized protein LOC119629092 [Bombyx mori]
MDLIDLNYCMTNDEVHKPKANVCFCCLNDSKTLIRFQFCKHRIFLQNHFKEKLNIQNLFVCVKCHSFMKKINLFFRQVEQSYSTLKAQIPYNNANITTNLIRSNIEVISNLNDVKEIKIEPLTPQFQDDIEIEVKLEEAPNISKSTVRSLPEPLQIPHNNVNMSTILNNYNFKVISTSNDVKEIKIEPITARYEDDEDENDIEVKLEEKHNISKATVQSLQEPLQVPQAPVTVLVEPIPPTGPPTLLAHGSTVHLLADHDNKRERQKRYREQNRDKLKNREAERRKRIQHTQSIAGLSASSNTINNEEIVTAQSLSGWEETRPSSIQINERDKEMNALQKKRERQRRYRQQNRDRLKQREAERRRRSLQNAEMITELSM